MSGSASAHADGAPPAAPDFAAPDFAEDGIHEGDCLEVLPRVLAALGEERFDLIYVDPPFNAGGSRNARLALGERARGTPAYVDAWGGLTAFLEMFAPRLALLREALAPRGSLWIHLDHRAVHDAKVLADKVFGRQAFQGEVIWVPGNGGKRRNGPSVTHQTILIYGADELLWNADDPMLREPFAETSQRMHFQNVDADGRRYRDRTVNGKTYRYYADEGRKLGSVWTDCPAMRANTPLTRETTGYPTQKPERLLERIIRGTTREGGRVLDPMCGSGTTLAVARRLGRHFTGIDQSPVAVTTARRRLAGAQP
jgi:site-specific DNA-methyltransferase (adenine-specific)